MTHLRRSIRVSAHTLEKVSVRRMSDVKYMSRSYCNCGWLGPISESPSEYFARIDALDHFVKHCRERDGIAHD